VLNSAYKLYVQGQKYTVHHDYGIEDIKVVEVMMVVMMMKMMMKDDDDE